MFSQFIISLSKMKIDRFALDLDKQIWKNKPYFFSMDGNRNKTYVKEFINKYG